jgi:hypothetical protein
MPNALDKLYLAAVAKMVLKSISLANSPALTEIELGQRTKDWAEFLFPIVPENMLQQSFQRAIYDHSGSFPLNFYEVKDAYQKLVGELPTEARSALPESDEATRNCQTCFGSGFVHKFDADGTILGLTRKRCDHATQPLFEGTVKLDA